MLKRSKGEKIFAIFNYTGMVLLSLIFLIPVSSSTRWVMSHWAATDWSCRTTRSYVRMPTPC